MYSRPAASSTFSAEVGQAATARRATSSVSKSGWTSGMRLPAAFDNNSPTGISTCGLLRLSSTVSPIIFPTSSITSGVREIEAFVDQGKVRNDVAEHSQRQRGPILKRRRLDVAARDFAVADSHPVKQLSTRRFDGRQSLDRKSTRL